MDFYTGLIMILNLVLLLLLVVLGFACVFALYFVYVLLRTKVPFVPSKKPVVARMIELANLDTTSLVYDLGCGNGRILFAAERSLAPYKHAAFTGYEINISLVWYTRFLAFMRRSTVRFVCQDFFEADLSDADIIFMYLWPTVMEQFFATKWQSLKPGTKLISHAFKIEDLTPTYTENVGKDTIYIYER